MNTIPWVNQVLYYFRTTDLLSKQNQNLEHKWTIVLHANELHIQDYFKKMVSLRATFLGTHFLRTVC